MTFPTSFLAGQNVAQEKRTRRCSSLTPSQPQAGSEIFLSYDTTHPDAVFDKNEEVYATLFIMTPSKDINRYVKLSQSTEGTNAGATTLPPDSVYLRVSIASRSTVDARAGFRTMVYDAQGQPVKGARTHHALANPGTCLDVIAKELATHPTSFSAYRTKWFYIHLFQREKGLEGIEIDLATIGDAETPEALHARVYLNMLLGNEEPARAAVLRALELAPTAWATSRAVDDYEYHVHSGLGTPESAEQVRKALHRAMKENPDSHLVRQQLYDHWGQLDFDSVRLMCCDWSAAEPLNPLPNAILAASSLASKKQLDLGAESALKSINGLLKGDGRISGIDNLEEIYLPWGYIVAAKIARLKGDFASAIAYTQAYRSVADDMASYGFENEARLWEEVSDPKRAKACWVEALVAGSHIAKKELKRLWFSDKGTELGFDSHLSVLLSLRRSANDRKEAPAIIGTDTLGAKIDLSSLRGRVVVLNFWNLGCLPCRKEIPELNELVEQFRDQPVDFLAFTPDSAKDLEKYMADHPFNYRQIAENIEAADAFEVSSLPVHVVIDGSGRIVARLEGAGPDQCSRIASLVQLALSER